MLFSTDVDKKAGMRPSSASVLNALMIAGLNLVRSTSAPAQNLIASFQTSFIKPDSGTVASGSIASHEGTTAKLLFRLKFNSYWQDKSIEQQKYGVLDLHGPDTNPLQPAPANGLFQLHQFGKTFYIRPKFATTLQK